MKTPGWTSSLTLATAMAATLSVLACNDSVDPRRADDGGTRIVAGADPSMSHVTFSDEVCGPIVETRVITENTRLSVSAGTPVGVDIRDASAPGANTFRENHCITYEGTTLPAPCPSFTRARGHF